MYIFIHGGGGAFQKITLMRGGGGMRKKSEIGGGVIQFSNYTPPNPTSPPYPIKNERSLTPKLQGLLHSANNFKTQHGYKFCWAKMPLSSFSRMKL